jgi:WD40 repeat protein
MTVLLVLVGQWHDSGRSACRASDAKPTEDQQTQLRLSGLEWALGATARDDHRDPILAAHHFFRAARAARLAGQESHVTSYLIAASYSAAAEDHYLVHAVRGAVFSPDSKRLLTYSDGPIAWLWGIGQTEPLRSFHHEKEILAANFNNDATRVLTYSLDGTVRLWSIEQAKPLAILRHDDEVSGGEFLTDETKILSWSVDNTARIWDVNQPGRAVFTFRHQGPVTGAVFNADQTKLLTSGDDNTARLWDAKTGKLIHKLVYEPRDQLDAWMKTRITEVAFCDDESHISFRCYDGVYLWDAVDGNLIRRFLLTDFTGSKPRFITRTKGVVAFYKHFDGKAVRTFHHGLDVRHDLEVKIVGFNEDRTRFLTKLDWKYYGSTSFGWVQLWETDGAKPLRTFHHKDFINGAAFLNRSNHILTYSQDGTARLWDIDQGRTPRTIRHRRSVTGALLSPNEKLLLTWTDQGTARLTERNREDRGQLLGRFTPEWPGRFLWSQLPPAGLRAITWDPYEKTIRHVDIAKKDVVRLFVIEKNVDTVALSPDGSYLFATGDRRGWLWNTNRLQHIATVATTEARAVFNTDASRVFYQTKEGGVLFDVKRRQILKKFVRRGDDDAIVKVTFAEDGIRIFTKGFRHVRLWDLDRQAPLRTFERDERIPKVVFSDDGTRFVTWFGQLPVGPVHLWHVDQEEPRRVFRNQDKFSYAVFSPDATRMLSWSRSDRARVWDANTGRLVTTFRPHGHISLARFTADGQRVLTVTDDRKAYLWDLHLEEPLRTFQHTSQIDGPAFADGGDSLIGQGDAKVIRWNIAVDQVRTIERQQRDHEIKTATRLDRSGRLLPLTQEEWQRRRAETLSPAPLSPAPLATGEER